MKFSQLSSAWLQRPLAILFTLAFVLLLPVTYFDLFATAILFAHYVSAVRFHPWGKIRRAGALWPHLLVIALLAGAAQAMYFFNTPGIVLFFGIHFVFTEVYESRVAEGAKLNLVRGLYYAGVYLFFMKYNLGLEAFGPPIFLVTICSLALLIFYRRSATAILFELSFLAPLLFAYQQPMRFSYILSYHVLLWWMIPLVRGYGLIPKRFLAESAGYVILFLVIVFGSFFWNESNFWVWRLEVTRFGYFHVALSFLMSALNPGFLRAGFYRLQGMLKNVV